MKKVLFALLSLSLFAVACGKKGPSAEELEKMKQDSIRVADSLAVVAAAEAAAKAKADSARVADSLAAAAAATKGGKKK